MKKIISNGILAAVLCLGNLVVNAQTNETPVSYNKSDANGFVTDVMGDKEFVASSLEAYFKQKFNAKPTTSKGYRSYKGVYWPEFAAEKLDVHYKLDHKKGNTRVTMLVAKGYDNFISSSSAPEIAGAVKGFMNTIEDKASSAANASALATAQSSYNEAQKAFDRAARKEEELRKEEEKVEQEMVTHQKVLADKEKMLSQAKATLGAAKAKS